MTFKTESLNWPEKLNRLQSMPSATRAQLKDALNLRDSQITSLRAIQACFDPEAMKKVHSAAQGNPPYLFSFSNAEALAGLKGKVADLPTAVHTALDFALARRLATVQIKALVAWIIAGKPAAEFNPEAKPPKPYKTTHSPKAPTPPPTEVDGRLAELFQQVEESTGEDKIKAQAQLVAYVTGQSAEVKEDPPAKTARGKKSKESGEPSLFWEWMLGVKFMSQLKSKAKKGELTTNEKNLVLADKFLVKPLGWVFGNFGKLFKKMAIGLWHSVEEAAGHTVKKILAVVLPLLFIVLILWALLAFFHFAVISPLHWMENKIESIFHGGESENVPTPVPVFPPVASSAPLKEIAAAPPKKERPQPTVVYQPAVSFSTTASALNPSSTLYDPKILESEIKSLPANCLVKDYPMTPDEGMPGDVAVSRMRDLTDPDKYTMLISGGKQTIKLVSPTNTTLTIDYKSTDIFNVLGDDKSPMNFLWEDVKYIHANEIDIETKNPSVIYQCSLVVSGSKYPLTIQCASAEDLQHLVSTMQYFIRSSRLAHDTALGGMPYLHQGLVFNSQTMVEKLWANGPMDKAGVKLSDMVWSVDKNAPLPPEQKRLEAQLGALTSGSHDLFIVSPSDRDKAIIQMNQDHTTNFNPKRQKVVLTAP